MPALSSYALSGTATAYDYRMILRDVRYCHSVYLPVPRALDGKGGRAGPVECTLMELVSTPYQQ
eukprot:1442164-Rhodomonas_salina.1